MQKQKLTKTDKCLIAALTAGAALSLFSRMFSIFSDMHAHTYPLPFLFCFGVPTVDKQKWNLALSKLKCAQQPDPKPKPKKKEEKKTDADDSEDKDKNEDKNTDTDKDNEKQTDKQDEKSTDKDATKGNTEDDADKVSIRVSW